MIYGNYSLGGENIAKGSKSSNDQRSIAKNPNNPAHKAGQDNRANQMNPNNRASKGKK